MADLPGTIFTVRFVLPGSKLYSGHIDYMDRDEATRNRYQEKWNVYAGENESLSSLAIEDQTEKKSHVDMSHDEVEADYQGFNDYMANPAKNGGLFTSTKDVMEDSDVIRAKQYFKAAQKAGSPLWQMVFSFDNTWLEEQKLLDPTTGYLNKDKIHVATRNAIATLEKQTGLNGFWTASLHYNTDNLHVHIGYVERQPTRKWIYYENEDKSQLSGWQYKGSFKEKALERAKSSFTNTLSSSRELLVQLDNTMKQTVTQARGTQWQSATYQAAINALVNKLPDNRRYWQYGYAKGQHFKPEIDRIVNQFLVTDGQELTNEIKLTLNQLDAKYQRNYGNTGKSYRENKLYGKNGLYTRLGNVILKEISLGQIKADPNMNEQVDKRDQPNSRQLSDEALNKLAKELTEVSQQALAKKAQSKLPPTSSDKRKFKQELQAQLNQALTAREKNEVVRAYQQHIRPPQKQRPAQVGIVFSKKTGSVVYYTSAAERDAIFRENKAENFDTAPLTQQINQVAPAINTQPRRTAQNRLSWKERRARREAYYGKRRGSYDNSLTQLRRILKQSSQDYLREQRLDDRDEKKNYQKTL